MARLQNVNRGFSLTEVLLAVGILSVGMIFIAGVFPAAIHFTTVATERTIAAAAADEAFAKIKFCGINLSQLADNVLTDFNDAFPPTYAPTHDIEPNEFTYPSAGGTAQKQYYWSALCRLTDANIPNPPVQVTVFVSRKVSPNLAYPNPSEPEFDWPRPIKVNISATDGDDELTITGEKTCINDGYTIVSDATGRIYRVLERYRDNPNIVLLDRNWQCGMGAGDVWVVPPPVNGGRGPCIAVYQKIIGF